MSSTDVKGRVTSKEDRKFTNNGQKNHILNVDGRNKISALNIIDAQKQNKIIERYDIDLNITKNGVIEVNRVHQRNYKKSLKPPNEQQNKYNDQAGRRGELYQSRNIEIPSSEENNKQKQNSDWRGSSTDSARRKVDSEYSQADNNQNKPKRKITRPIPQRDNQKNEVLKAKPKPKPPTDCPPPSRRVRRTSSGCSQSSQIEERGVITHSSSLHEPFETPTHRSRRSPLRMQNVKQVNADEIPIDFHDSSDDEKHESQKQVFNPYFSDSESEGSKKRKENRPTPLVIDQRPRSREARRMNAELEKRNKNAAPDSFVLKCDEKSLNRKGGKYYPPNWSITVQKIDKPNDAKYVHQIETRYSMSSILNAVKRT